MKDQLLRIGEVLAIAKCSRATLYRRIGERKFPRQIKNGASAYWKASAVQQWLDALGQQPGPESVATEACGS
ncbi:MAG: AlpA family phage regulatory protein [Polyangiaceae bacterium]|nr:AlpA family phage regulatory protein [Polyangiaceae bacterium]